MKQPYCIAIVSTPEAMEQALSQQLLAIFLDEFLLDDKTEHYMAAKGYLPGLIGWTGKLFLHPDFDHDSFDLSESLSALGIQSHKLSLKDKVKNITKFTVL